MSVQIVVSPDARTAAEACGAEIFSSLETARRVRGKAALAVSGGSTPRIMFEWMAKQNFDWRQIEFFWVDERCVPINDPQSNYRMTLESLLDSIQLQPAQIHRVRTEMPPAEAAAAYSDEIRFVLGDTPVFDIIQRGMGPDSHTASLFPGEPLIEDRTGIAASVWVKKFGQYRVTLLPGVLERARKTLNLVTGADKRDALREILHGPIDYSARPAMLSSPEMIWYLDTASAE